MSLDKFVNEENERNELRKLLKGENDSAETTTFNNDFFHLEETSNSEDKPEPIVDEVVEETEREETIEEVDRAVEEPTPVPKPTTAQKAQRYLQNEPTPIKSLKEEVNGEMYATIERIVASMAPYGVQGTGGGGLGVHAVRAEISDYTYNKTHIDSLTGTGQSNTASNVGGANELFKQKSGVDLQFRTLSAGDRISITSAADTILIDTIENLTPGPSTYTDFNTTLSANPTYQEGRVFWDSTNHTLAQYTDISAVTQQIGQEFYIRVINDTGVNIPNGSPVTILSARDGFPTVRLAFSHIGITHSVGVATHEIGNGEQGLVTLLGTVGGVDTSMWEVGDDLYLSTSAGILTHTPPSSPYTTVEVGHVIVKDTTEGKLLIKIDEKPLTVDENQLIYVSVSGTDISGADGTDGKPYKTIKYAMSQITDNSITKGYTILVKPGTFNEVNPIQMKPFVSVKGLGAAPNTIVNATVPNQSLFIGEGNATLENVFAVNLSGYCFEANTSGTMTLFRNIMNGKGLILVNHIGATVLADETLVENLNPIFSPVGFGVYAGDLKCNIIQTVTTISADKFFEVSGANATCEVNNIDSDNPYTNTCFRSCDSGELTVRGFDIRYASSAFSFETSSYNHILNGYIKDSDLAVSVDGNTTKLEIYGVATDDCVIDFISTSGTKVIGTGNSFRNDRMFIDGADVLLTHISEQPGDEGFDIKGELHVGSPEQPKESCLGQGDSYTRGMLVYQYNPSTSAYTNVSVSAAAYDSLPFGFGTNTSGTCLYMASDLQNNGQYFGHQGVKLIIDTSANGGAVALEYWNGTAWTTFNYMVTDSDSPYYPYAKDIVLPAGSYQVRYDNWTLKELRWKKNDPIGSGVNRYWTRWRITTPFTQAPIFQQIKLHANRMEINGDGWPEYYGRARPIGTLPWDIVVLEKAATAPGDQDLYISDNIDVGGKKNAFDNGDISRVGFKTTIPYDCDTSTPVKFDWSYVTDDASTGNINWVIRWGYVADGGNVYYGQAAAPTSASTEKNYTSALSAPIAANTLKWSSVNLDISNMRARRKSGFPDTIWLSIQRTGTTDTHGGDVALVALNASYAKWCDGGHIDPFND